LVNAITYTIVIAKNTNGKRNDDPYLYFISDLKDGATIARHYLKRWKIECCFRHLKSNGFNIEDINLKVDDKIELMMGVLAVTYMMAIKEGAIKNKTQLPQMKTYKNKIKCLAISIFRKGYHAIQQLCMDLRSSLTALWSMLKPPSVKELREIKRNMKFQNV
jgi:transposase